MMDSFAINVVKHFFIHDHLKKNAYPTTTNGFLSGPIEAILYVICLFLILNLSINLFSKKARIYT